ncbi:MAG: MFS transporter [Pirellulales bacterium]|nr:MFS transporter [Pirellulales bacterium]
MRLETSTPSAHSGEAETVGQTEGKPANSPTQPLIHLHRGWVTAALMTVMVLAAMEMTITSTAMPTIIGELHGLEHYAWVTSVYLLMCTVTMPLYGRLADALGRKPVVLFSIGLFCGASVLASTSQSMWQLIVYRGLQGLGAGGIMPVVLTILGDIFTLEERAKIQGWFSAVWGTSALAGPAIGAVLVNAFGWRSIFFVNLPLGALGLGVLAWHYHDREQPQATSLDLPGVALLAIACSALLGLVSVVGSTDSPWLVASLLLAVFVVGFAWFVRVERRASNPIFPLELMMHRGIGPALVGSALMGVLFFGVETYVPLYVQGTTGGDASAAAGVITPLMFAWAASGIFVAPLLIRWGFRRVAVAGSLLAAISFTGLVACAVAEASGWVLASVLVVGGVGFGSVSMPYLLSAQDVVAWGQRGIVTSAIQFFRTMGGAVGIGLLGMLFNVLAAAQMEQLRSLGVSPASIMDPHTRSTLPSESLAIVRTMIDSGLTWVFVAMALLAMIQVLVTLLMPRSHGKAMVEVDPLEAMQS